MTRIDSANNNRNADLELTDNSDSSLLNRLPITRIKLFGARVIYRALRLVLRDDRRLIRRKGINYDIDLSEGIDLSLFVFGGFQDHVTKAADYVIAPNAIILDVGANIGVMSLRFAQQAPAGQVYAFEPTAYAYRKLLRNLSLNPELAARITPIQAFCSDRSPASDNLVAYSSWKIDGSAADAHPLHGGTMHSTESADVFTIDEFCRARQISAVDLIKIDTDGHELQVLRGASETLARFRPTIIFEAGLYAMAENESSFEQFSAYLSPFGYTLISSRTGHEINRQNYRNEIPLRSTIDIVAVPPAPRGATDMGQAGDSAR
jgi:FkbM family methyltransferase